LNGVVGRGEREKWMERVLVQRAAGEGEEKTSSMQSPKNSGKEKSK
jgi:hypothetical protein